MLSKLITIRCCKQFVPKLCWYSLSCKCYSANVEYYWNARHKMKRNYETLQSRETPSTLRDALSEDPSIQTACFTPNQAAGTSVFNTSCPLQSSWEPLTHDQQQILLSPLLYRFSPNSIASFECCAVEPKWRCITCHLLIAQSFNRMVVATSNPRALRRLGNALSWF